MACAPFDQTGSGTISSPGQTNSCTFSANASDKIDFTVVATSGSLSPEIQIYNSMGKLIAQASNRNAYGSCSGGSVIELNTVPIPANDTYTEIISDCSSAYTGNYVVYSQRTNNPSGATMLLLGQTQTGAISSAAQDNSYTFTANANDVIDFTMVTTSGSLSPRIRVYDTAGMLLADAANRNAYGSCSGGSVVELNTLKLTASGTYTVLVGDCGDTSLGNYTLYAQRTNNPSGATILPFGQTLTGAISSVAQDNTYTFTANANDVIDFTMVTTSGSLSPRIRLYNTAGMLLDDAANRNIYGSCSGGSVVELDTVKLAASGTYTDLVGDCGDASPGNYTLYAQRTENPSGTAVLPFRPNANRRDKLSGPEHRIRLRRQC